MRCLAVLSLVIASAAVAPLHAQQSPEGPFGLQMGMSLDELRKVTTVTPRADYPGVYLADSLPRGHPEFVQYLLVLNDSLGLCRIAALGKTYDDNDFGTQIQRRFSAIADAVTSRYGKAKRYDFLKAGSIWKADRYWMMGLLKKERYLSAYWSREHGSSLPPEIASVALEANATSPSQSYLTLNYEFSNFDSCQAAMQAKQNAAF